MNPEWESKKKHLDVTSFVLLIKLCFKWASSAFSYSSHALFLEAVCNCPKQKGRCRDEIRRGSETKEPMTEQKSSIFVLILHLFMHLSCVKWDYVQSAAKINPFGVVQDLDLAVRGAFLTVHYLINISVTKR